MGFYQCIPSSCWYSFSPLTNSSIQVLWNGVPLSKFRPVRGIRQGCPLSPYLFVLCMDWLSQEIHSAISEGQWKPIRLSRLGPPISHLFFADDLVIFSKADQEHCCLIKEILERFCDFSGYKINARKTNIFFAKGMSEVRFFGTLSLRFGLCFARIYFGPLGTDARFADMVKEDGSWNLDLFRIWLPEERVLSNIERVKRGLADDPSCHIYGFHSEDILHILRDCPAAKDDTSIALAGGASWACLFRIVAWRIWKNHNLFIFQGHPWSSREIVNNSYGWASQSFSIPKDVVSGVPDFSLEEQANGFTIFLNTDGAVRLDTGNASAGGAARDMNGQWLFRFNRFLGKCSIFDAELWGILEVLKIIQRRGHDHVIILSDSLDVIRGIQGSNSATSNSALIRRIQSMLSQESSWCLRYIPREQNEVADCMAKEALLTRTDLQFFDTPSFRVRNMLDLDQSKSFLQYVGCN
ncbi:hypothetical protein CXB51_034213 [Gossypium anomalum]|uniref:Reverse transcriptase domain-containing protein n=1 Tax=Gossypium anomalum TaxID=47600 RepID=A0A8J5XPJ1_9ROSI|nr:hypothetical protein CXB51_034213 [Gossypium anomalum]